MTGLYKDQRKVEQKVGIVAIIVILILVFGYAWMRNVLHWQTSTRVQVKFANSQGLEIGDKVSVNGMQAGRVTKLAQLEDGVLVYCQLQLDHPLREGARFLIQDSNLMGGKQLEITNASTGKPIDISKVQTGEETYGMTALVSMASTAIQQINYLLLTLNQPNGVVEQARNTLTETRSTVKKVGTMVEDNKADLSSTLKETDKVIRQLSDLITQSKPQIDQSLKMAPLLMANARSTLDSLQVAGTALKAAVKEIRNGKNSLSGMLNDDELYRNLLDSSARLDSLLMDIKKHPSRYIKVKVF